VILFSFSHVQLGALWSWMVFLGCVMGLEANGVCLDCGSLISIAV
jgi:hypothetical protein